MSEEGFDLYPLEEGLLIGHINVDEEVNKRTKAYLSMSLNYIRENKFRSCEEYLSGVIPALKEHPFEHLTLMTIKIYCSLRLNNYRSVSSDLNSLGNLDKKNYNFEHVEGKYKKKSGSMISFLLRLINCYYPYTLNLYFTSFDRLYLLILHYEKLLHECTAQVGSTKGQHDVSSKSPRYTTIIHDDDGENAAVERKKVILHNIAVSCYVLCDLLLKKNYVEQAIHLLKEKILKYDANHIITISLIGKLYLLMGAMDSAGRSFDLVEHLTGGAGPSTGEVPAQDAVTQAHTLTNATFFNLYLQDYPSAMQKIISISPNLTTEKKRGHLENDYAIYTNNLAVTYFFNNDVNKSMQTLEEAVTRDQGNAYPALVKNLNILYEFTKHVSIDDGIFKSRVLNPFHYKREKMRIMKYVNSLAFLYNEFKSNVEDLEKTYENFLKALKVSKETEERLLKMNDVKTASFISEMEDLKREYDLFKDSIEDKLNNKKNEFEKTLTTTIDGFFQNSVKELKGISKYIKYINLNATNLHKIVSSIFSKAMNLSDIYEQNINHIYEIGKEYYRIKLSSLNHMLASEYEKYNKTLGFISNEKYLDNFSDVFYIELLKNHLKNSSPKTVMIDLSNIMERRSFHELSYFFNIFLKNFQKGIIIYVVNRVDTNCHNNKMIFIEYFKLYELVHYIKNNYSHLKIDFIEIHVFNMYISFFVNANGILYHVNYEYFLDANSISLYNAHNYGYFFTNQKIPDETSWISRGYGKATSNRGDTIVAPKERLYVLYVGSRVVQDNCIIYNRKDMIEFKKDNAYKIIQQNKFNSHDSFVNIFLLKLESEYNFYNQFLNSEQQHLYRFSVHNCNMILTYDSLSKFDIPHEKFTPHFKDVYTLIIIYPGSNISSMCSLFNNYIFRESIYNLRKEQSNVLEIYADKKKLTMVVNNKTINYYVKRDKQKKEEPLESSLLNMKNCLKQHVRSNYDDYFDYLNIIYFVSSD
ncbi:hypothetical protein AK88_01584 [Plasmodium fragile]|uniref:Tetratricopeptide repeat protein n=1 Tax=Plasmodium fragile TaxID=5857 RepID=A0A0D9QP62_PLAFR|nr:uncharacterized protein AK88_01584 [Plasmodium fragile]KJP88703.1 hypothetical protein AK88_01584 [Plasmodium fragile]